MGAQVESNSLLNVLADMTVIFSGDSLLQCLGSRTEEATRLLIRRKLL